MSLKLKAPNFNHKISTPIYIPKYLKYLIFLNIKFFKPLPKKGSLIFINILAAKPRYFSYLNLHKFHHPNIYIFIFIPNYNIILFFFILFRNIKLYLIIISTLIVEPILYNFFLFF